MTLDWIYKNHDLKLIVDFSQNLKGVRLRGSIVTSLNDVILCIPATFDLRTDVLLKYFELLITKLNASNAKLISDALLCISRKVNNKIFVKFYLDFIHGEQFRNLGKLYFK